MGDMIVVHYSDIVFIRQLSRFTGARRRQKQARQARWKAQAAKLNKVIEEVREERLKEKT